MVGLSKAPRAKDSRRGIDQRSLPVFAALGRMRSNAVDCALWGSSIAGAPRRTNGLRSSRGLAARVNTGDDFYLGRGGRRNPRLWRKVPVNISTSSF